MTTQQCAVLLTCERSVVLLHLNKPCGYSFCFIEGSTTLEQQQ